jgi:hypothetical protein
MGKLIRKINSKNNLNLFIIYFLWLISLIAYFIFSEYIKAGALEYGVNYGSDSAFYLRESRNIINGDISAFKYKGYFGYLLFLAPFLYFDLPLYNVVLFQIVLTAISAFCLYKITKKFFCKSSGLICVFLFLLYFPLQLRNFYILTDMLYIDLLIILIFFVVFFKKKNLIPIFFLLFFLVSIRPNGMLFLFSIFLSLFVYIILNKKYLYLISYLVFLLITSIPVIIFLNSYLSELNLLNVLNKGIIWGYSFETNQICESSCLSVELINNNLPNTLLGYFKFVSINYTEYFKVFFLKVFWFLFRARPYYSDLHNFYILLFNLILYSSFVYGFMKKPNNLFSINCIVFYILLSMVLVGLTFADWSGRFSLYILPLIMIFSSYGILVFIKKVFKMIKQKRNYTS